MTLEDVSVTGRPARPVTSALRTVLRAPADARARRELLFCLAGLPFAIPLPVAGFILALIIGRLVTTPAPDPTPGQLVMALVIAAAMLPFLVLTGAARRLGGGWRRLAALLLGVRVPAPVPLPPRRGPGGRMTARLRDRPGWRAAGYLMAKFPVALFGWYAVFCWVAGVVNISYPFWWLSFRNHAPDVHLSPVPVFTPFGWGGRGTFYISTFPGTFAALGAGAFMLLAAPWLTRTAAAADRWLIQGLLGPGTLRQRLADLEQTRALAIDDSAALLRQLERNLHDGAQIRLATLAMNLGMAREKLGVSGGQRDLAAVCELVDAAHRGAKDALGELRELARGIHPPVLDNGLADALTTLAADSAIPAVVTASIPRRPTPAIEAIAYFCAAELLANAVKHSCAKRVTIDVTERSGRLQLAVADDGRGGAGPAAGGGLAGLAQRVRTVDGRLSVDSPPGGPTRVTIELPLRA